MMAHHTLFFPIKLPFECHSIRRLTIQFARNALGVFCLLRLGLNRGVGRASVPASPLLAATPGLAGTLALPPFTFSLLPPQQASSVPAMPSAPPSAADT